MYFQVVHSVKRSGSCCKQHLCMHEFYSPVLSLLSVWLILLRLVTCIKVGSVGAAVVRSSSAKRRKGHYNKNRKMKPSACIINVLEKSSFWLAYTSFLLICLKIVGIFSFPKFRQHLYSEELNDFQGNGDIDSALHIAKVVEGIDLKPSNPMNLFVLRLGHGGTPSIWDPAVQPFLVFCC